MAVEQACYNRAASKLGFMRVDIVPHDKLAKREDAQACHLEHFPLRLPDDFVFEGVEDLAGINAMLVERQGVEPADVDAKVAPEHFEQADIDLRVLIADDERIPLLGRFPDDFDGDHHQRRVMGARIVGPKPAKCSERHVERI